MPGGPFATCAHCGDRIGVYEPVIVIAGDTRRTTSLANEPQLVEAAGIVLMHQPCAGATPAEAASG
jgi:hypothetical protein